MSDDVFINSLGAFLPGDAVSSADMESYLGLIHGKPSRNRAVILRQNRIKTRYYALSQDGKAQFSNAAMAAQAVKKAVQNSEAALNDITYLATATAMGDMLLPGLASHVHAELGLPPIEIASFQSVCASSLMALKSAWLQVRSGEHQCAAIAGSEFASRYFRPGFYEQVHGITPDQPAPLEADFLRFTLSDGAGAVLMENRPNARQLSLKIKWIELRSYADRFDPCMVFGAAQNEDTFKAWGDYGDPAAAMQAGALMLRQDFSILQKMIPVWVSHYLSLIDRDMVDMKTVRFFCSHYSAHSLRNEALSLLRKTDAMIEEEKWFSNLYTKGNTGSASIFIILEELYNSGQLRKGDQVLCHVPESGRCINGFMLLEAV